MSQVEINASELERNENLERAEDHQYVLTDNSGDNRMDIEQTPKKRLSRIRQRDPKKWVCNVRKENDDRGKEYISVRKKLVAAREIKTKKDCFEKCIHKCARKISEGQRKEIFLHFYQLNAQEKRMFVLNTSTLSNPERRRKGMHANNSRKSNSYSYFF